MKIYYNPKLKPFSRELRNNSTLAEVLLWNELKGRKMCGYQFMRQKPIGNYIVDFYCGKNNPLYPPLVRGNRLVIEIDGESYDGKFLYDIDRQQFLESLGLRILRFHDLDVKKDVGNILLTIEGWIENAEKQPPNPL